MTQPQTSPTGRLVCNSPALQSLPVPLTDAQRLEKERLRAALFSQRFSNVPPFFRWAQHTSERDGQEGLRKQAPLGTYVDSLDHYALWSGFASHSLRDAAEVLHQAMADIEAARSPRRKTLLAQALGGLFGCTVLKQTVHLH